MPTYLMYDGEKTMHKYCKVVANLFDGLVDNHNTIHFFDKEKCDNATQWLSNDRLFGYSRHLVAVGSTKETVALWDMTVNMNVFYRHFFYEMAKRGHLCVYFATVPEKDPALLLIHNSLKDAIDRINNDNNFSS